MRSRDPEFSHQVLRESFLDFAVRPSGSAEDFEFSHDGVAAPEFTRAHVRYSMDADVRVGPGAGPVIVETLWSGRASFDDGREEVQPAFGVPVLFPSDVPGAHYRLSDVDVDTLVLDRPALHRTAGCLFGIDDPSGLGFDRRTPVTPAAAVYFDRALAHVQTTVLDDDEIAAAPLVLAEATRSLATAVLLTFPNSGLRRMEERGRQGWAEPAALRRALDYIEEHAAENIAEDDIADAARTGVHGLQILFRRHRSRTPMAEVRRARLSRAHLDLVGADPARGDTVATIAARWGFADADRFGVQYQPVYGCSPAETLCR